MITNRAVKNGQPSGDRGPLGCCVAEKAPIVRGAGSGFKHFGIDRLGLSGLAIRPTTGKDNIRDIDRSRFSAASVGGMDIPRVCSDTLANCRLMRELLPDSDHAP